VGTLRKRLDCTAHSGTHICTGLYIHHRVDIIKKEL
jgi:hypothetical protein